MTLLNVCRINSVLSLEILVLVFAMFLLAYVTRHLLHRWLRWGAFLTVIVMVGIFFCTLINSINGNCYGGGCEMGMSKGCGMGMGGMGCGMGMGHGMMMKGCGHGSDMKGMHCGMGKKYWDNDEEENEEEGDMHGMKKDSAAKH